MKTYLKLNGPMWIAAAVIAVGVFLLLSLVAYERVHYENPDAWEDLSASFFFGVSALQFNSLGGAAYFLVMIALAWAVIVFFRERDGEILLRGAGTAVLVCAAATLFALWGNDYLGGSLGAGIASVVKVFPGAIVGSVLMSAIFVISFIVATDWLFYSALREAVSGPDLMRDAQMPAPVPSVFEPTERVEPEIEATPDDEGAAVAVIETEEPTVEFADDPDEVETPADEIPADEIPADETPADETPAEATPAEATRVVVEKPGAAATEAAVPAALRQALGAGRGTIEVEPVDVEFADDEDAAPAWSTPVPASPAEAVVVPVEVAEVETPAEVPEPEDPAVIAEAAEIAKTVEIVEAAEIAEAEETAAVLLDEDDMLEEETPEATRTDEKEPERGLPSELRVEVGHRGHRIEVEPSDVEFAEPVDRDAVAVDAGTLPAVIDEEEVFVDEDALRRMGPVFPTLSDAQEEFPLERDDTEATVEESPDAATPVEEATLTSMPALIEERAGLRRDPAPDPDVAEMPEAHLGMVLEDEIIDWAAFDEASAPAAATIVEVAAPAEEAPPATDAIAEEVEPKEEAVSTVEAPAEDVATTRMAGLLDSLLGPAPNAYVEEEPETLVALADEDWDEARTEIVEDAGSVSAEVEPESADATAEPSENDEFVVPPPVQEVDLGAEESASEVGDSPEEPPKASASHPAPGSSPEAAPAAGASSDAAPAAEASAKAAGLLGWFRRRRIEEIEQDDGPEAPPERPRRREPETPSLFDRDPAAGSTAPDGELVDRAARLAIETGRASIVLFQRKLAIGYHRARALVDSLVTEGVLGPMGETGSHPVLVSEEAWARRESPVA